MSKRDEYGIQLKPLIFRSAFGELEDMLISNSNLPGPRGNLELAYAFADCLKSMQYIDDNLWQNLNKWIEVTVEETPSDSPKEFIPFCAVQALGAIFTYVDSKKKEKLLNYFRLQQMIQGGELEKAWLLEFNGLKRKILSKQN